MAGLRGTLDAFAVADIFQLIGLQTKTGILTITRDDTKIAIFFVKGNVVRAEEPDRPQRKMLGSLLVRGEMLTEPQLEEALAQQKKTARRLGDVLVDRNYIDRSTLTKFTYLQTTETIYPLFGWKTGNYEFIPHEEIEYDEKTSKPIRADSLLMEGFRIADEWPAVRRTISDLGMTFSPLKPLPEVQRENDDDDDDLLGDMEDLLGGGGGSSSKDDGVTKSERTAYDLVTEDRSAQDIIDRSLLGEFETCKSLASLIRAGYLESHLPRALQVSTGFSTKVLLAALGQVFTKVALYAVVAVAIGGLVRAMEYDDTGLLARDRQMVVRSDQARTQLGEMQRLRISRTIRKYRLLEGHYPKTLDDLVKANLLSEADLRFPYATRFAYRTTPSSFVLAKPLR